MDYKEELKKKLGELKEIEGFPIGTDKDILELSIPPFYTACPNPFISDFLAKHGSSYDESSDTYHKEPFLGDVSEGKNHPSYNVHSYHTKVPFKAIVKFIEHYTKKGDVVLDAFSGTGMTGLAASHVERNCILSDLSTLASFVSHNYTSNHEIHDLFESTTKLINEVEKELDWLFKTKHKLKSGKEVDVKIINIIWSDVLECSFCAEDIVYWDASVIDGQISDEFACPSCNASLKKKDCNRRIDNVFDSVLGHGIDMAKQVPVQINYRYDKTRYSKEPDAFDLRLLEEIEEANFYEFLPLLLIPDGYNTSQPIKSHKFTHIHHFFTKRNLIILSQLYSRLKFKKTHLFLFTSILNNLSKRYRYRTTGGGGPSGNLFIPSLGKELNPFIAYRKKLKSFGALTAPKSDVIVSNQSATHLKNILSNSIDYIFTDPPFGDNIMYSEMNLIWEAWLKVLTNNTSESIINKVQNKGLKEYNGLMQLCFNEYFRVLKPKRWITVVFHNSKASVWNGIQEAITKAGFMISQVSTLDKKQGSFKQVTAPGSVANDLVISAFKPSESFSDSFISQAGEGLEITFISEFLSNLPSKPIIERTEKMLYSKMVAYYIQRGYEIKYDAKSFYSLLKNNFIEEYGFWFTSDQINSYIEYKKYAKLNDIEEIRSGGLFLFVSDEKSALVWLHNFLNQPKSFSDVSVAFNQLANIQDDQVPELRDLLEENFVFDGGIYRRPKSEEEHNQITDKRQKHLWKEFETILIQAQTERKKIKEVRKEALAYGFERCYKDKRFKDILTIASKLHPSILENSGDLTDFVEAAEIQTEGLA